MRSLNLITARAAFGLGLLFALGCALSLALLVWVFNETDSAFLVGAITPRLGGTTSMKGSLSGRPARGGSSAPSSPRHTQNSA